MRSTAIAWLLFVAGCTALALDGPDTERATAERRDRPPEKASGDATCEAGSVPVLDESFGEDSPGWPEDWLIAGDGEGFVEDGAGHVVSRWIGRGHGHKILAQGQERKDGDNTNRNDTGF